MDQMRDQNKRPAKFRLQMVKIHFNWKQILGPDLVRDSPNITNPTRSELSIGATDPSAELAPHRLDQLLRVVSL